VSRLVRNASPASGPDRQGRPVDGGNTMPVFDRSASRPSRHGAGLLRSVLGSAKGPTTRQRRAMLTRAFIALTLIGAFCGSAVIMSESCPPITECCTDFVFCSHPPLRAATETHGACDPLRTSVRDVSHWITLPSDGVRLPAHAMTKSKYPSNASPVLSAIGPHRLRPEYLGEISIAGSDTRAGASYGQS
jgi:hypothetical protein